MKQKEQLNREAAKWVKIYMKIHKQIDNLVNSITPPLLVEKFSPISLQIDKLEKQKAEAWTKWLESKRKLSQCTN